MIQRDPPLDYFVSRVSPTGHDIAHPRGIIFINHLLVPSYPSILDLTLNTPIRREFSACHSMITRPERCKAYVFIYILLFRNVHSVDTPVYTYLSFTLSRATKRNNVMKQETYIYILFIIYIRISFNPPPSLGNYPESLLCHFPPFSYHFHSCTAFVRLPHCFLAFHRTCTDRPVRGRITQHCRSPLSLSLSLSCIN